MGDARDTICALSTVPGRGAIAVVRVSGPESFPLLEKIFAPVRQPVQPPARQMVLGSIVDPKSGRELDQALVTRFPAPHSYTGEDVVEVSLHGSPVLVAALLDLLCSAGARLAEPGEFSMRAFLNGRMDLTQAEAVRDVVAATTMYQAQVAVRQRSGEVARKLHPVKQALIDIIVPLETAVEFVEEDVSLESRERLASMLEDVRAEVSIWIDSFRRGRIVHDGFSMAIVGRPNVGKSSLFNALLERDRSIVTENPGTTRDLVSEYANLEGIPVRIVDTAGVRSSEDEVEKMGVDRSYRAMADADVILLVVDSSRLRSAEDDAIRSRLSAYSSIVVMNKSDMPGLWAREEIESYAGDWTVCEVSAKTGDGLRGLRKTILNYLYGEQAVEREDVMITNLRQCRCLEIAARNLSAAAVALREGLSEEYVLMDLHGALRQLGAMTGETGVEDLLSEIFSRFCIGK